MSETSRFALHQLHQEGEELVTQEGVIFDQASYSRFKYGDGVVAREYAVALTDAVTKERPDIFLDSPELVIVSAPYGFVPKGAKSIADNLTVYLNSNYLPAENPATTAKITILETKQGDYGKLSHEERIARNLDTKLSLPREKFEGKNVVVIDDVRITGGTECLVTSFFEEIDLNLLSSTFLYLAQLDAAQATRDPQIEDRMNHAAVKTLSDLAQIIKAGQFLLNARVCKFIFSYSDTAELEAFYAQTDTPTLSALREGAHHDGYNEKPAYNEAIQLLTQELEKRKETA